MQLYGSPFLPVKKNENFALIENKTEKNPHGKS